MTTVATIDYSGKVAFVTGAGSGIGRATVLAFLQAGASVTAVDIDKNGLDGTLAAAADHASRVHAVVCDVTDGEAVRSALKDTVAKFGRLDCAFNNAGIEQPGTNIGDITEELWDRVIAVNLKSVFLGMKYQIEIMLENGGGAIVNTSSGAGVLAIRKQSAYCASKFGVTAISKVAALEYADKNIRVNAICPGIIDTPMMDRFSGGTEEGRANVIKQEPIGRMGNPAEIAGTVLWLCSDAAGFVTGHAMVVDGGQTAGI